MFEHEDFAILDLETTNYRHLQAEAKKMGLPCNVKKVHLIELIRAKRYCSETDLKILVDRVKMARKINGLVKKKLKKKRVQGTEVSSTSQSPPLSLTPKRSDFITQYNPDMTIMDYQARPNILRTGTSILQPLKRQSESDRVLRSSNSVSRPNYRVMEQRNYVIDMVKTQKTLQETVQDIRQQRIQKLNELHEEGSHRLMAIQHLKREKQLVPVVRTSNILGPKPSLLRTRKISGIYPLPRYNASFDYTPTVDFRRSDGKLTKINAVVQKLHSHALAKKQITQPKLATLQDVINYEVEHPTNTQVGYPNKIGHQIAEQPTWIEQFNQAESKNILRAIEYSEADQSNLIEHHVTDVYETANQTKKTAAKVIVQRNSQVIEYQNAQPSKGEIDKTLVLRSVFNKQVANCNVEYQRENLQRQWKIYDINDQSLTRTEKEHSRTVFTHKPKDVPAFTHMPKDISVFTHKPEDIPVFTHKPKDIPVLTHKPKDMPMVTYKRKDTQVSAFKLKDATGFTHKPKDALAFTHEPKDTPVPTHKPMEIVPDSNIKFTERKSESMSRDYQSEYQKFEQELETNRRTYRIKAPTSIHRKQRNLLAHTDKTHFNREQNFTPISYQTRDSYSDIYHNQATNHDLTTQSLLYPNMQPSQYDYTSNHQYNHKNIRAEGQEVHLPKINDAFSQFNDSQSRLTQPLYVQVSEESDRLPMPPIRVNSIGSTCMLETIYNFKNQFVMNPPVLAIVTTKTDCTYCCNTVTTPLAMPAAHLHNNADPYPALEGNQPYDTRACGGMKLDQPPLSHAECDEVLGSWSTTSLDLSQNSQDDDNTTIPDMVEDAMELISQDGDYMERIGMDLRVKCIVCDWAGPKSILEHHIKQKHVQEIQRLISPEWSVLLTLGELLPRRPWASQLAQLGDELYVVSARYSSDDAILIALSIIPNEMDTEIEIIRRGRITVYNKISGKPYIFEGEIYHIPDCMPDEYDLDCLSVNIGDLDLMPNSANLKLVNTELVGTPDKVVFGQPKLNQVEIVVYVKLLD